MKKNRKKSELTRQALLNAALLIFYNRGVVKATVQDIVKEACVTRGAFYWHFKNKEEVLEELVSFHILNTKQILSKALQEKNIWSALETSIKEIFQHILKNEQHRQFSCIMYQCFSQQASTNILRPFHERYHVMWKKNICEAIGRAKHNKELSEELDDGWAFTQLSAMCIGLSELLLSPIMGEDSRQYTNIIIESTMNIIASTPVLKK